MYYSYTGDPMRFTVYQMPPPARWGKSGLVILVPGSYNSLDVATLFSFSNTIFLRSPSIMTDLPTISASAEDYLEAIFRLIAQKGAARVRDIADALSVHKSTVSWTLKSLAEKGLVNYSRYEITTLTTLGEKIAQDVHWRHEVIGRFLMEILGVGDKAADANACRMEHVLDSEVMDRLALLLDFAKHAAGNDWIQQFQQYATAKPRSRGRRKGRQSPKSSTHTSTLDQLKPGEKASIVKIGAAGAVGRRMADMGMVHGATVEVVKVAPLGDPIEIKVKGYSLSLRKEEAAAPIGWVIWPFRASNFWR